MEESFKGIVISAKDYKEKDKIITLFSVEKGLINIKLKSVKSPNAKMKYAKELFSFGEFKTAGNSDFKILTSCDIIETFKNLSIDPEKYLEASSITSVINNVLKYNEQNVPLFMEYITALKTLCYFKNEKNIVLAKFLIKVFELAGYMLDFDKCSNCSLKYNGKKFLLVDTGEIVCQNCKNNNDVLEITPIVFSNMRILANISYEKLNTFKLKALTETISLLLNNYKQRFSKEIKLYY